MKKLPTLFLIVSISFFLVGWKWQSPPPIYTWQDIFRGLIMLVVAAGGAPATTLIRNVTTKILKRPVEDRQALVVTAIVALVFAVVEMFLSGLLSLQVVTLETLPTAFAAVFTVASLYFGWLKNSEGFFGKGFLLKKSSPTPSAAPSRQRLAGRFW